MLKIARKHGGKIQIFTHPAWKWQQFFVTVPPGKWKYLENAIKFYLEKKFFFFPEQNNFSRPILQLPHLLTPLIDFLLKYNCSKRLLRGSKWHASTTHPPTSPLINVCEQFELSKCMVIEKNINSSSKTLF